MTMRSSGWNGSPGSRSRGAGSRPRSSRRIFGAVSEFTAGVAQYDDQTVLIARVAGA